MALSRNYRLIVAPRKFDVLKTNMLALRTSNFQGATIRLIVPRHNHYIFFRAPIQKSYRIIFNFFRWKPFNWKRTKKNQLNTISIIYLNSRATTIHPGIFLGRALWADSVSQLSSYKGELVLMKKLFPFKNHMHTIVLCQRFNRTIPLVLYKKCCYLTGWVIRVFSCFGHK